MQLIQRGHIILLKVCIDKWGRNILNAHLRDAHDAEHRQNDAVNAIGAIGEEFPKHIIIYPESYVIANIP